MENERRRKYTRIFKVEAVGLVRNQGYRIAEPARSLGINANMLGRWRREVEGEDTFPRYGDMKPKEEELRQLRRENKRLRMEREIITKKVGHITTKNRKMCRDDISYHYRPNRCHSLIIACLYRYLK